MSTTTTTPPIFDAGQLRRATSGDGALQAEILSLFAVEVERLMRQVEEAAAPELRGDRLRALITLARNTGAAKLAHEARALETEIAAESHDLDPLRHAVAETLAYIRQSAI